MFEAELAYFKANQYDLVAQYNGKVLTIKDQAVLAAHDDALLAYLAAKEANLLGSVMFLLCKPGPEAYTAITTSNCVKFS
jgi:hypothetical protein